MEKKTALAEWHMDHGAKMVPFAGFSMPLHYGSQLNEHHFVRKEAGLFDVSHMQITQFLGDVIPMLQFLLSQDVTRTHANQASYGCLLNETGGIIDDVIVYNVHEREFWMVSNAATKEIVLPWLTQYANHFKVDMRALHSHSMLACQGPRAAEFMNVRLGGATDIPFFGFLKSDMTILARTGYTGEDGFELIAPHAEVKAVWEDLIEMGVKPCGLGARDTLRLEAGLNLYGQDMDASVTPLECGLSFCLHLDDRDFLGKAALLQQKESGTHWVRKGLVLKSGGVLRHDTEILGSFGKSVVTSGSYSPTLGFSIGMARLPKETKDEVTVRLHGKEKIAELVSLPFVKRQKL